MSIRIDTNISAINAHRMLARNNEISSGMGSAFDPVKRSLEANVAMLAQAN
jgi:hypothetical protein